MNVAIFHGPGGPMGAAQRNAPSAGPHDLVTRHCSSAGARSGPPNRSSGAPDSAIHRE
jgi:hypothetical protein